MEKDREYEEVTDALTSLVTCSVVSHAIRHAYVKVCDIKEGPVIVTKQELMQDIKRDFRFVKGSMYRKGSQRYHDEIIYGNQYRRDEYTGPFFREYEESAILEVQNSIRSDLPTYNYVKTIDLAGQLQHNPNELLSTLLDNIAGCPLEVLVLTNNNIGDDGLKVLATKIRSFHYLHSLYLNNNLFGDDGIESLFHTDNFPTALRILNIAYNRLGKISAWSIGRMFSPGKIASLEELFVGGQVTYHYSIDEFFISLIPHVIYPGARKLKRLDISSSGLSLKGLSALITLISWTTSIESLNISQISIEPTKFRYQFILSLLMNQSLRQITLNACGFRLSETKSIQDFIETRHQPEYDISTFLYSSYQDVHWCDQIEYLQHIVTQRTILEQKRVKEENEIIEAKYTPPPVLRPVLQTKKQDSLLGCGVTSVEKASKYLSLEEIAKLNPLSIASRSRRSVSLVQRAAPIEERYKYPLSIKTGLQIKLSNEHAKKSNEMIKREQRHLQLQKSKSSILIRKDGLMGQKPQQTHEKRYQKYIKNSSNRNEMTPELKLNNDLLKYYSELIQFGDMLTVRVVYTNLESIFLKYFLFNKVKREILIINTPHQYAHYVTNDNRLYRHTLQTLRLLKDAILSEEEIQDERKRGDEIKRKINCQIFEEEVLSGVALENDEDDLDSIQELNGKIVEFRGIGRSSTYAKEYQLVDQLTQSRDKLTHKYADIDNYKGILYHSPTSMTQHIYLDRDSSMTKKGLYDYYLEYRRRYLIYHKRYISLTTLIVDELEECFLLCQSLSTSISVSPTFQSLDNFTMEEDTPTFDEECIHRMQGLEMIFQELYSLQHELMTIVQIIHSLMFAIEITYYENIFKYSQSNPLSPSNISPTHQQTPSKRRKFSYTQSTATAISTALRVFNPSCPVSSSHVIRCLYPCYSLSAIYVGYYFLSQEIYSRFKDAIPEAEKLRPSSRQTRLKEDSISYKSLLPVEEESVASSSQTSSRNTESVKRKPFNPTKGRKMKYPTKEEFEKKPSSKILPNNQVDVDSPQTGVEEINLPKISAICQPASDYPESHKSQSIKVDAPLPSIPLSSSRKSHGEVDKDDVSALTSPGGSQSERFSSKNNLKHL